jgi:hypothetical protein
MSDDRARTWSRRELIAGPRRRAETVPPPPPIQPRSAWAGDLQPTGPLDVEQPGDVRFLLVHHTASTNDYGEDDVAGLLRSFYAMHTGPEKGWADIAYNFLIDRFGRIWEGRAGSLAGPVKGDATGGSQGFAQLCCLIGDHSTVPPTPEAQASLTDLLAYLAGRYEVDPTPGTTVTFTSRGSNRWPAGTSVTTTTIAGHRDMSATACPGDAAYPLVRSSFAPEAARKLAAARAAATTTSTTTTTTAPVTTSTSTATTAAPTSPATSTTAAAGAGDGTPSTASDHRGWIGIGAAAVTAAVGGAVLLRRRRL